MPTPTSTVVSFPSTGILDNFNRSNGGIGSGWSGATSGYSIKNNKLDVGSGGDIYWSANAFGPSQEAYLKLATVDGNGVEQHLLLKAQCNTGYSCGVLEVEYDAPNQRVKVKTYESSQGWVQRGADISVSFANGDILGARATSTGQVSVYKNGVLQATRDITAWPYYDDGGYIGVWFVNAGSAYGDDFGGGSMPGASLLGVHVKASLVKVSHEKAYRKAQMMQIPPAGQVWKSYYFSGSVRIALRVQVNGVGDQVYYLLADHLGSTSITVDVNNSKQAELRYAPWGTTRYAWGETPTDYRYTGQRAEFEIGLYFYQSRFYDANLGRFTQADTIIPEPGNVQDWDRYAAMRNNPIRWTDPSGYNPECGPDGMYCNIHVPRPGKHCTGDCFDAYQTFKAVVKQLGYIPDMSEVLYMTAATEYAIYMDYEGVQAIGQEGLARYYYEKCTKEGVGGNCQGDKLYTFLSGYEPWSDRSGIKNNKKKPGARADHLIEGLNSQHNGLMDDMSEILDPPESWTTGYDPNRPYQWYGPFTPNPENISDAKIGGFTKKYTAILSVKVDDVQVFWMFSGIQNTNFNKNKNRWVKPSESTK